MGQVWAGRETGRLGLPRLVAIKTALPYGQATYEKIQELFVDEAQVAASIDHPNVCKILELGQDDRVVFIVMEWIHGVSLQTLLRSCPSLHRLDFGVAAHIVAQTCAGLHAAHELKDEDGMHLEVVHRDATPHNLLITRGGEVKIIDFGIVKSRNQIHQATEAGEIKGKIAYLAPEQLRGTIVDRRADIFTVGCVLYLATTGCGPFVGNDAGSTIMRIMHGEYRHPSTIVPNYPKKLEAIVARALATEANERFQTADEMRRALEEFLMDFEPQVTRGHVAAVVEARCGKLIEQRRAEIRTAQKLFESQSGRDAAESARSGTYPVGDTVTRTETFSSTTRTQSDMGRARVSHEPTLSVLEHEVGRSRGSRALVLGASAITVVGIAGFLLTRMPGVLAGNPLEASRDVPAVAAPVLPKSTVRDTPAETAPSSIEISVQVPGAKALISIDGGPMLPSPQTLNVPADQKPHLLRVQAPGYEDFSRIITFDRSQSLSVDLVPERDKREPQIRTRRIQPVRSAVRLAKLPTAREASPPPAEAPPAEAAPTALKDPFSEPMMQQPRRHAIDESDPFANH
jgi:serine/threonine-protein kinase